MSEKLSERFAKELETAIASEDVYEIGSFAVFHGHAILAALRASKSTSPSIAEAVKAERERVLSSLGFPYAYRKFKTPCAAMTDEQLSAEDTELDTTWKRVEADDEGAAGSPGEWVIERSGEIDTERQRRARSKEG